MECKNRVVHEDTVKIEQHGGYGPRQCVNGLTTHTVLRSRWVYPEVEDIARNWPVHASILQHERDGGIILNANC